MAKEFWIDSSDPPYPAIRHRSHPQFDARFCDLVSLTQARKTLKEHCRSHRQHWLAVMNYQLSRNSEAIIREVKEIG